MLQHVEHGLPLLTNTVTTTSNSGTAQLNLETIIMKVGVTFLNGNEHYKHAQDIFTATQYPVPQLVCAREET